MDEGLEDVMMQGDVYAVYYDYMGSMKKGVKRSIKGEEAYAVITMTAMGIILSAELISKQNKGSRRAKMDDQKLKDIFKFDEGDLQANRSGNLSEKQKNVIVKRRNDWKKTGINYSSVVILIGLGIIVIDAMISLSCTALSRISIPARSLPGAFTLTGRPCGCTLP